MKTTDQTLEALGYTEVDTSTIKGAKVRFYKTTVLWQVSISVYKNGVVEKMDEITKKNLPFTSDEILACAQLIKEMEVAK